MINKLLAYGFQKVETEKEYLQFFSKKTTLEFIDTLQEENTVFEVALFHAYLNKNFHYISVIKSHPLEKFIIGINTHVPKFIIEEGRKILLEYPEYLKSLHYPQYTEIKFYTCKRLTYNLYLVFTNFMLQIWDNNKLVYEFTIT